MANQVAETILAQLGGNKFVAMTGAKNLVNGVRTLYFDLPRGAANKANKVRVTLTAADEYTVGFFRWDARKFEAHHIEVVNGIHASDLRRTFTDRTGLECSL